MSEEITGSSHWDYHLAEGETITVVMENDAQLQSMTGHVIKRDSVNEGRLASTSGPGREVFQYTAKETTTYRVNIGTGQDESMTVEIYMQRN